MNSSVAREFIEQSISRMEENTPRISKCLDQLTDEEIWSRPNQASNSIGNIILHLCGNIRQYAISSLGGVPDVRERDKEFAASGGYTREALETMLSETVSQAIAIMKNTDDDGLLRSRLVQGFNLSGIGIIIHVTEHYSYHMGQIAFWTKLLKDADLGFYANINLNVKNVDL